MSAAEVPLIQSRNVNDDKGRQETNAMESFPGRFVPLAVQVFCSLRLLG